MALEITKEARLSSKYILLISVIPTINQLILIDLCS